MQVESNIWAGDGMNLEVNTKSFVYVLWCMVKVEIDNRVAASKKDIIKLFEPHKFCKEI